MREYVLGLYEKSMPSELSLREMAFMAKEAGYDFLELSIDETEERLNRLKWNAAMRRSAFLTMSDAGIPIGSICLSGHRKYPLGHPDPMIRSRAMEIMEDAIGLADDLGIRMIQLAGYDVYYEAGNAKTRECFAENLGKSVAMAAKAGVILAFETMETDFLNTVEKAMYWVERIGSPYLQVYPDSGNITNAAVACGRDVLEDLRAGAGHVAAVHLKETVPELQTLPWTWASGGFWRSSGMTVVRIGSRCFGTTTDSCGIIWIRLRKRCMQNPHLGRRNSAYNGSVL